MALSAEPLLVWVGHQTREYLMQRKPTVEARGVKLGVLPLEEVCSVALDLVVQKVAPDLRVVSVFVAIAPLHVEAISKK